jgi:hypothetical protein
MRPLALVVTAIAALSSAGVASASIPENGFIVFKESRLTSVTQVRATGTGQVVYSAPSLRKGGDPGGECSDRSYVFSGPRWDTFGKYFVNVRSTPKEIDGNETLADIQAAHEAWQAPFVTNCKAPKDKRPYVAEYGGTTTKLASLVTALRTDGENTVTFQSLAGTVCDGATACVVLSYQDRTIREADLAFERRLTRYGYADYWTTDDETWWNDAGGRWSVSDVATHEFGHFAGLDHVDQSPSLTMFPFVHDGAQTLGLGDMLGIAALY